MVDIEELQRMFEGKTPEAREKYKQFKKDPVAAMGGVGAMPGIDGLGSLGRAGSVGSAVGGFRGYRSSGLSPREQKERERARQAEEEQRRIAQDTFRKRTCTAGEILAASEKAGGIRWYVPGLIAEGGLHLIAGAPGAAKTYSALDLAHHIVTGQEWMGRAVKRTNVMYVDEEMGPVALGARMRQLGVTADESLFLHCRQGYKLHDRFDINRLTIDIQVHHLGLIIFDSMVAVHDYAESENSDMRKIRDDVRPLLDKGCAVLFLHHNRKGSDPSNAPSQDMARGAGDIVGMMDMAFSLVKTGPGTFRLSPTKPRLIPEEDAMALDFRLETDEKREHVDLVRIDPQDEKAKEEAEMRAGILEALANNADGLKSGDLAERFPKRGKTVKALADRLVEEGLLWSESRKERGAPIYYGLKYEG